MNEWSIWEIFVNAVETGVIILFLISQLGIKQKKRYLILGYFVDLLLISGINLIDIQMSFNIFGTITIYVSKWIAFGILLLFATILLDGSASEKIVWVSLMPFVSKFSDFVSIEILQGMTEWTLAEITEFGHPRMIATVIYLFASATVYISIVLLHRKEHRIGLLVLTRFRVLLIALLVLGTIAIDQLIDFTFFAADFSVNAIKAKTLFINVSFLVILCSAFLLILKVGRMTTTLVHAQQDRITDMHYADLERSYNTLRAAKHDINNHLKTLSGLYATKSYDELGRYLEEFTGRYDAEQIVLTGCIPLDVLLSNKKAIAQASGIKLENEVRNAIALKIPYADFCSIIGNLLDNAIEACNRLPVDASRWISIQIARREQMLNVTVTNSADGRYIKRGNVFLSSKSGSLHGIGLSICESMVKRHGGHMFVDAFADKFHVAITFPIDGYE